ncbi:MAG: DUF1232 domain-containing protein [Bacteroides sp.]|nr:DUF1232 domain-containing protein [Bacteroides sp.]
MKFYADQYNPGEFMKKLGKVAKQVGASTVYHVLLLYYALGNKDIPLNKRLLVMAALGYFVLPLDIIPDFLVAGFADDVSIILFALREIASYITVDVKDKAKATLRKWFGEVKAVDITDPFTNNRLEGNIKDKDEITDRLVESFLNFKGMELYAKYDELNTYLSRKFKTPIVLGYSEGGDLKVSYTRKVLFKEVTVPVTFHFIDVQSDSFVVVYKGAMGLDLVIGSALNFIIKRFPEYSPGILPEDGHRVRIDLKKIKKAQPIVSNIALRTISPEAEGIRIHFVLKA